MLYNSIVRRFMVIILHESEKVKCNIAIDVRPRNNRKDKKSRDICRTKLTPRFTLGEHQMALQCGLATVVLVAGWFFIAGVEGA